jgi:WD40 repeat protein
MLIVALRDVSVSPPKASVGADGTSRLWNLVQGNSIILYATPQATFVDWSPTGAFTGLPLHCGLWLTALTPRVRTQAHSSP